MFLVKFITPFYDPEVLIFDGSSVVFPRKRTKPFSDKANEDTIQREFTTTLADFVEASQLKDYNVFDSHNTAVPYVPLVNHTFPTLDYALRPDAILLRNNFKYWIQIGLLVEYKASGNLLEKKKNMKGLTGENLLEAQAPLGLLYNYAEALLTICRIYGRKTIYGLFCNGKYVQIIRFYIDAEQKIRYQLSTPEILGPFADTLLSSFLNSGCIESSFEYYDSVFSPLMQFRSGSVVSSGFPKAFYCSHISMLYEFRGFIDIDSDCKESMITRAKRSKMMPEKRMQAELVVKQNSIGRNTDAILEEAIYYRKLEGHPEFESLWKGMRLIDSKSLDGTHLLVFKSQIGQEISLNYTDFHLLVDQLKLIHEVGIAHRDIRPPNLLVLGKHPAIIDLGFSVPVDREVYYIGTMETASNRILGLLAKDRNCLICVTKEDDMQSLVKSFIFCIMPNFCSKICNISSFDPIDFSAILSAWEKIINIFPFYEEMLNLATSGDYLHLREKLQKVSENL